MNFKLVVVLEALFEAVILVAGIASSPEEHYVNKDDTLVRVEWLERRLAECRQREGAWQEFRVHSNQINWVRTHATP